MNKNNNSIINSPAPPSIQQTGQNNVNVTNLPGGNVNLIQNSHVEYDENGVPYTPVNHVRFDSQNSIIYLGNEQVSIPVELVQLGLLNPEELPYVNALCDVYAEKLGKAAGRWQKKRVTSFRLFVSLFILLSANKKQAPFMNACPLYCCHFISLRLTGRSALSILQFQIPFFPSFRPASQGGLPFQPWKGRCMCFRSPASRIHRR